MLASVKLGHSGLSVHPIGLGCMSMSQSYGVDDDDVSTATVRTALDLGVDVLDTSDVYGASDITWGVPIRWFGHNGRAIAGRHDDVVLATKFAAQINPNRRGIAIDGRPDYVRAACEASLARLQSDVIDLYYCHRLDPSVPIEDTACAMSRLVEQGKVRALGLGEMRPEQLRRAQAVHPTSALQPDYFLWERGVENDVASTCCELGIALVPCSRWAGLP